MHDAPVANSPKYIIPGPLVWKGGADVSIDSQERVHELYVDNEDKSVTDIAME